MCRAGNPAAECHSVLMWDAVGIKVPGRSRPCENMLAPADLVQLARTANVVAMMLKMLLQEWAKPGGGHFILDLGHEFDEDGFDKGLLAALQTECLQDRD